MILLDPGVIEYGEFELMMLKLRLGSTMGSFKGSFKGSLRVPLRAPFRDL